MGWGLTHCGLVSWREDEGLHGDMEHDGDDEGLHGDVEMKVNGMSWRDTSLIGR